MKMGEASLAALRARQRVLLADLAAVDAAIERSYPSRASLRSVSHNYFVACRGDAIEMVAHGQHTWFIWHWLDDRRVVIEVPDEGARAASVNPHRLRAQQRTDSEAEAPDPGDVTGRRTDPTVVVEPVCARTLLGAAIAPQARFLAVAAAHAGGLFGVGARPEHISISVHPAIFQVERSPTLHLVPAVGPGVSGTAAPGTVARFGSFAAAAAATAASTVGVALRPSSALPSGRPPRHMLLPPGTALTYPASTEPPPEPNSEPAADDADAVDVAAAATVAVPCATPRIVCALRVEATGRYVVADARYYGADLNANSGHAAGPWERFELVGMPAE